MLGKETGSERAQLSLAPSLPPHTIIPEQTREFGTPRATETAAGDAFDEEFTSHQTEQLPLTGKRGK